MTAVDSDCAKGRPEKRAPVTCSRVGQIEVGLSVNLSSQILK